MDQQESSLLHKKHSLLTKRESNTNHSCNLQLLTLTNPVSIFIINCKSALMIYFSWDTICLHLLELQKKIYGCNDIHSRICFKIMVGSINETILPICWSMLKLTDEYIRFITPYFSMFGIFMVKVDNVNIIKKWLYSYNSTKSKQPNSKMEYTFLQRHTNGQ